MANLTTEQIQTLDCGTLRLDGFPLALTKPNMTLSTLEQLFDFVDCATDEPGLSCSLRLSSLPLPLTKNQTVLYNIETKINGDFHNETRSPEDFVAALKSLLLPRGAGFIDRITHQSFDWRAIVESKKVLPELRTSALVSSTVEGRAPRRRWVG